MLKKRLLWSTEGPGNMKILTKLPFLSYFLLDFFVLTLHQNDCSQNYINYAFLFLIRNLAFQYNNK